MGRMWPHINIDLGPAQGQLHLYGLMLGCGLITLFLGVDLAQEPELRWIVEQGSPLVTATNNTDYMAEDLGVVGGFELTEAEIDEVHTW